MGIEPTLCWENLRSLSGVEISYGEKDTVALVEPNREIPAKVCAPEFLRSFQSLTYFACHLGFRFSIKARPASL